MDSFTENILQRARDRQKFLESYSGRRLSPERRPFESSSEPNLTSAKVELGKTSSSEGNVSRFSRQNTTRVSSHVSSSPNSPKLQKTLNIQNENFNMEIKVSSADNVRVEVQIEEEEEEDKGCGLRPDAKNRLNRLGKLCAGGDDADISSPIHRTEGKFLAEDSVKCGIKSKRGLGKLADLAQNINQWEDDLPMKREIKATPKASSKQRAPAPPKIVSESPKKAAANPIPKPPRMEEQKTSTNPVKWDKRILDSLESQGFTRTDSNALLVFKYNPRNEPKSSEKENLVESPQKTHLRPTIADKAAIFESSSPTKGQKDPALLSVSERKALFEKNRGAALVPKAPFAMATPIKSNSPRKPKAPKPPVQTDVEVKPIVHQAGGIANKVAALFEGKSTIGQEQIESGVREQRQKEMDMLLNRFHKTTDCAEIEADEKTAMIPDNQRVVTRPSTSQEKRRSGGKRCGKADSPKVAAVLSDVKRIKVSPQKAGRLYPSLTDIESTTETENEEPRSHNNSSSGESIAESDDVNTSFGRDILNAVCHGQTPQKRQIMDDSTGSEMSDLLDGSDDFINEALSYNEAVSGGPSPPKQGRQSPIESSTSFRYKQCQDDEFKSPMKKAVVSPRRSEESPTYVVDGNDVLPLTHTVSFYRKLQSQSTTPVRQISRPALIEEDLEDACKDLEEVEARMVELKKEILKQEMIISQTSQALNLCSSTPEFMGSTEQVEAERVLLVATHRRQGALHELQRLKVEKSLKPQGLQTNLPIEKGSLVLTKIVLPLKQKYIRALAAAGGKGHHVVCLIKYGDQVLPTPLVSTVASNTKNPESELNIPGTIKLNNVYSDFTITFEVYCLQAQEEMLPHEVKYHIKKPNGKLTPKKNKQDSRLVRPAKESPAGPNAVRSPTFALMGYVVISVQSVNKKQWTLNNTPSMSPLEGVVEMNILCEMALSVEHRGFLTMFEDVSGFGAWHRRWCLLRGHILSYWKYPDDEKKTTPLHSIDLKNCITTNVGPVSRDICARLHTFLLETERLKYPDDRNSLTMVRQGDKTVIRHLLSADTKEERVEWCRKFGAALAAIHTYGKDNN